MFCKRRFSKYMCEMNLWFIKQDFKLVYYPERVVDQGVGKVNFSRLPRKTNREMKMYI